VGDSARYLYAITRGLDPASLDVVEGLDGSRLEVVDHRGLSAIVSDVDLDEYGEEPLRQNLERLDWLEKVARTHDSVIQAVTAHGPTAPLRLATICLDDDGVRRRLDEWFFALEQVLDRVEGRMEWSVKVFAPEPAAQPAGIAAGGPVGGAEYLRRKKDATQSRSAAEEAAARVGAEVHESLSSVSVASRLLQAQDARLTGHAGTMVLNGAYLVEVSAGATFETTVRDLMEANPSVEVSCVGPWPPYSFAMLEQR
jgi:hypothetical protein